MRRLVGFAVRGPQPGNEPQEPPAERVLRRALQLALSTQRAIPAQHHEQLWTRQSAATDERVRGGVLREAQHRAAQAVTGRAPLHQSATSNTV